MTIYTWAFGAPGTSLDITVQYDSGSRSFAVHSKAGSFDLNALWFSDGDASRDGSWSLNKAQNALNMQGSGEAWDDVAVLSNAGLGKEGVAKSSFVSEGETLNLSLSQLQAAGLDTGWISDWSTVTLGLRATSVNGGDSVKLVAEPPSEAFISVDSDGAWFDTDRDGLLDAGERSIDVDLNRQASGFVDFDAAKVEVRYWELTGPTLDLGGFGADDRIVVDLKSQADTFMGYEATSGWAMNPSASIDGPEDVTVFSPTDVYLGGYDGSIGGYFRVFFDETYDKLYSYTDPNAATGTQDMYGFDMAVGLDGVSASQIEFLVPTFPPLDF